MFSHVCGTPRTRQKRRDLTHDVISASDSAARYGGRITGAPLRYYPCPFDPYWGGADMLRLYCTILPAARAFLSPASRGCSDGGRTGQKCLALGCFPNREFSSLLVGPPENVLSWSTAGGEDGDLQYPRLGSRPTSGPRAFLSLFAPLCRLMHRDLSFCFQEARVLIVRWGPTEQFDAQRGRRPSPGRASGVSLSFPRVFGGGCPILQGFLH